MGNFKLKRNMDELKIKKVLAGIYGIFSQTTVHHYAGTWEQWERYLEHPVNGTETVTDARGYIISVKSRVNKKGQRISQYSVRKHVVNLNSLYSKLVEAGAVKTNPFAPLLREVKKGSKGDRNPTKLTPFEAIPQMFKACDEMEDPITCRAMLALLYGAGRRIGELLKMNVDDVCYTEKGHLYVRIRETKNSKDFNAVIPDNYKEYLEGLRDKALAEGTIKLFPHSICTYRRMFKKVAKKVGLDDIAPHSGRATSITFLLSEGLDYQEVKEFSGHSTIQMVAHYDKRRFALDNSPALKINFVQADWKNRSADDDKKN